MKLAIMQPYIFPYIGYFQMIRHWISSDAFLGATVMFFMMNFKELIPNLQAVNSELINSGIDKN